MHLNIIKIEKFAFSTLEDLSHEYMKRLKKHYPARLEIRKQFKKPDNAFNIILDPNGKNLTTPELTDLIVSHTNYRSKQDLNFFIGGPFGLSDTEKQSADLLWSLSASTTTSDISCVFCIEQVYRAITVIQGIKYQH